jgi:hypothetical protein
LSRPGRPKAEAETEPDGYKALAVAILTRAVQDARGVCDPRCSQPRAMLQAEAVAWLQDESTVAGLVEMAGYDADAVMRRVRQLLARPDVVPQEVPLFPA